MRLMIHLQRQIDDPALTPVERARLRCRLTKELEDASDYEAARHAMGELWHHVGERPQLDNLDQPTAAEVLLRAGALSGWIGRVRQIEGAQEIAKDLISESINLFEELHEVEKACEAQIDLAICYWREGAFDEARVMLNSVLNRIAGRGSQQEIRAYLNLAVVERSANRNNDSLRILLNASPLFQASDNQALKGRFHNQLGLVLKSLGTAEGRADYIDRALVEYAAASFHFSQSGNLRYRAAVENNLGFLFLQNGRYRKAHEHLDRAQRLLSSLKDNGAIAQLNDTRARIFLAQGANREAEKVVRAAVLTLAKGDELPLLAEALMTHGVALARLGKHDEARARLERAMAAAERAGDNEAAGVAAITLIEEIGEQLSANEMQALYDRADELLSNSQDIEMLKRLRACARRVMGTGRLPLTEFSTPTFIYADERTGELLRTAHLVAGSQGAVLITGETGTGKEVLARLIHEWSGRTGKFIAINCAALTETLLESLLFGHLRGSFVDAARDHAGVVREAAGGTLFLDNIAELSLGNQGKLLRLIEQGEIHPIGAARPERVDVRIVAAANCDLKERAARREFRDDLFYRLGTFHLIIPPLRERPADIAALATKFIKELTEQHRRRVTFMPEAIEALRSLPLEGNARGLRALIERTVLAAVDDGAVITRAAVEAAAARITTPNSLTDPWAGCSLADEVLRFENRIVKQALEASGGSVTHAARLLGITHQRLCAMLQSRHKSLLLAKKATRPRKRRIITKLSH